MTISIATLVDPGPLSEPARVTAGGRPQRRMSLARRVIAPVVLVFVWIVASSSGWIDPSVMPSPRMLGTTFVRLWTEQDLLGQIRISLGRAVLGGAFGVAAGVALGIWAGLFQLGEEAVDALMQMLRTVPFLALVPLFVVWFGIGDTPKLLLIGLATTFPMYLNTYAGVRNVDRKVIEAARSFGVTGPRLIREVVLPQALPNVLTGLRFALGASVLILIAAEQINASAGIGYLLTIAQVYQQVDVILICIAIYALLGLVADLIVRVLEWQLMPWRAGVSAR